MKAGPCPPRETCGPAFFKDRKQQDSRSFRRQVDRRSASRVARGKRGAGCEMPRNFLNSLSTQSRRCGRLCQHCVRDRQQRQHSARTHRAGEGSAECRSCVRSFCRHVSRHCHAHGTVVRSVPPATSREKRILTGRERRCERTKEEEQDQKGCESLPHLAPLYSR